MQNVVQNPPPAQQQVRWWVARERAMLIGFLVVIVLVGLYFGVFAKSLLGIALEFVVLAVVLWAAVKWLNWPLLLIGWASRVRTQRIALAVGIAALLTAVVLIFSPGISLFQFNEVRLILTIILVGAIVLLALETIPGYQAAQGTGLLHRVRAMRLIHKIVGGILLLAILALVVVWLSILFGALVTNPVTLLVVLLCAFVIWAILSKGIVARVLGIILIVILGIWLLSALSSPAITTPALTAITDDQLKQLAISRGDHLVSNQDFDNLQKDESAYRDLLKHPKTVQTDPLKDSGLIALLQSHPSWVVLTEVLPDGSMKVTVNIPQGMPLVLKQVGHSFFVNRDEGKNDVTLSDTLNEKSKGVLEFWTNNGINQKAGQENWYWGTAKHVSGYSLPSTDITFGKSVKATGDHGDTRLDTYNNQTVWAKNLTAGTPLSVPLHENYHLVVSMHNSLDTITHPITAGHSYVLPANATVYVVPGS